MASRPDSVDVTGRLDVTGRPTSLRQVDLGRFFQPRRVAVIGATDTDGRPTTAMWRTVRDWADRNGATCVPVNPNRSTVDGVACKTSIAQVQGDIDLAVILVRDAVAAFEEVVARGARFAVIFAAGFSEVGGDGRAAQQRLEALAEAGPTHLIGPNTNLNAFEAVEDLPGPKVALITQSGHQGRPVFEAQRHQRLPLSHWAPTGNEADLEFADFAGWFVDQPDVGAVAAYIEGFKDGRTLALAADRAARAGKPIVVVKVGRSDPGRSMARSHTGHLAGSDAVVDAAFRQFGITRVDTLDELIDVSGALVRTHPPSRPGRRNVCIYSISGGTGAHMADLCGMAGLEVAPLSARTQQALRDWIPRYLRVSNPVDTGGGPSGDERGPLIVRAIVEDPEVDLVICPITGALGSLSAPLARSLIEVARDTTKPIFVVWGSPDGNDPTYTELLLPSGLPVFRTFSNCVTAARAWFDHHEFTARYRSPFAKPPRRRSPAAARTDGLLDLALPLTEHDTKQLLAVYGITTPVEDVATSAAEAARLATHLGGPVVMKVSSTDLSHKSDLGLVRLGVSGAGAVRATYRELLERAAEVAPHAYVEGVLVSQQVRGGIECVMGISRDELFGPVVMFGLGGILVDLYADVTFRVPPFDRDEASRMIGEPRGSALLSGLRGARPADRRALIETIMRVQRLAIDHADSLAELDINPLAVLPRGEGAIALDALAVPR